MRWLCKQPAHLCLQFGDIVRSVAANLFSILTIQRVIMTLWLFSVSSNLYAATQGSIGTTSVGTVGIQVVNNDLAWIKGLNDINLGTWSGSGDMSGSDDICVLTNALLFQLNNYYIRASGNGDAFNPSAFTLSNGAQDIYYRVMFDDVNGQIELLPGQLASGLQFFADGGFLANVFSAGCPAPNATVTVLVEAAELATGSGTHSGTLVLELVPE